MKKSLLSLMGTLLVTASAFAQNLLPDSVFVVRGPQTRLPFGWSAQCAAGAQATVDPVVAKDGAVSLKIETSPDSPKTWNMLSHSVPDLKAKTPYTVSAWVKTAELEKGAMAYISLNCFSGTKRLAANDSGMKLSSGRDWTRIVFTLPELPKGTSEARIVFCLYGHGTAWFTQPQVESGKTVTDYAPAPADSARAARRARQSVEAKAWLAARRLDGEGLPRVAVLDLGLGVGPNAYGYMSDPGVFERALTGRCRVTRVTGDDLCNAFIFCRDVFDLLIVPTGSAFPAAAADALVDYLSDGGQLLTCGGYAFNTPLVKVDGTWLSPTAFSGLIPAGTSPISLAAARKWHPGAGGGGKTVVEDVQGPQGEAGIRLSTPSLVVWNTASTDFTLKGHSVVSFFARGDARTEAGWFEVVEKDGSRWHAKLELTEDWKEFRLTPAQFTYWQDNASVGRGRPGDHVNFDSVAQLSLGLAVDVLKPNMPHSFSVCGVMGGVDPHAAERCLSLPQINTRTGRIRDAIHPEAQQIQLFDCCEELLQVVRTATSEELGDVLPKIDWQGGMKGLSTRAQLGVNGHGFGPNRCAWRPLLDCFAADGSLRGYAGGLVHNFAETFAGSSWAFFGVTDRDLFAEGGDGAAKLLPAVVDRLLDRVNLCETAPGYSCYRVGEIAKLGTRVANWGRAPREVEVRFRLMGEGGREVAAFARKVLAQPCGLTTVEVEWPVAAGAADYLDFTVELVTEQRRACDRESGAFVVWTPAVIAKGPKTRREGLRLTLDGESRFFAGAQTFWGQHQSVTARSPRRFRDDFRQMRDFGLRWTRCFLPCRTEAEFRDSDAIVQLAQKFGLAIYHTPNLAITASAQELEEEVARLRKICERYREVPGFAVDICNEPSLKVASPAFRKALGSEPKTVGPGDDPQINRTFQKSLEVQRTWAKALVNAAHAVRPELSLAIGWSQGWAGGAAVKDPQVASLDLDFTDRHYYGPYEKFMEHVKDIDLRVLGKPFLVGECGSKNHPTFQKSDPWGMTDDDAKYTERFRYLYSHAFGCGATAILSWHWRDPIEGQFPCGLVMPSGIPRPTAYVVKRLANTFSQLELVDNPPDVVVLMDEGLRQTGNRAVATEAAWRVDEELQWWGANWCKLTSSMEKAIPSTVKLVIRPEGLSPETLRNEIGNRLKTSGAYFTRRASDPTALETFRVPGRGASGWVFWNGGMESVEVERCGQRLTVGPKRVGYLQIADDGCCQVKEEL